MLARVVIENGVKKIVPLTADCGSGNPCGAIITVYQRTVPNGYLPLGAQYDITQFPVLYSILGTDTIPTASALGLPTLTTGQYVIKATSGINENQANNVLSALTPVNTVVSGDMHSVTSNAVSNLTSTKVNTSKSDANLCYADSTRVEFFRLTVGSANCPPSNDINPIVIQAFTYNNGNYLRVTQMAYDNYSGVASYIRSGYGTVNDVINWSGWNKITTDVDLLSYLSKDNLPYNALTTGQNINNLKTRGIYQAEYDSVGNSLIGRPNENIFSCFLFVFVNKNNAIVQVLLSGGSGELYIRQANDSTAEWKSWHKMSYTTIGQYTG